MNKLILDIKQALEDRVTRSGCIAVIIIGIVYYISLFYLYRSFK